MRSRQPCCERAAGMSSRDSQPAQPHPLYGHFPGLYRLVSSRRRFPNGHEVDLHGGEPKGQTYYDAAGHMWVLLAPAMREPLCPSQDPTDASYRRLLYGVVAYYGTYVVDPTTHTVVHCVETALDPEWVGQRFVRNYLFLGNRLTLIIRGSDYVVHTIYERLDDTPTRTQEQETT